MIVCNRIIQDETNGGIRTCGGTKHTLSGSNTWITIRRATENTPSIRVLKQRYVCKDCGGFNFRHLDGSLLKNDYTDEEVKQLVVLTQQKLSQKKKLEVD